MRLLHSLARTHASFDDPNLVSRAGLVPVMALAQRAGLTELVAEQVRPGGPCGVNAPAKIGCLVAGMTAGADSIDDMDLLRHGAMDALFGGIRAPSTLGSHLRSYSWGNVRQLEAVNRQLLAELARRAPLLPGKDVLAFVDIDSMQKRVYGHKKQGARFGHTKIQGKSLLVRGLNALAAVVSTPLAAPVIAATRLRGGNAASARGAASFAAGAIATARAAGCTGLIVVRMDSAYYAAKVIAAIRRAGARFSVTVPMDPKVKAAIAAIPGDAWTAIKYPRAIWDDQLRAWVSDAQVAEAQYTAFTSQKGQAVTARLIVRRVRDLNKQAGAGQDELFPVWRYHAVFTDSAFDKAGPGRGTAPRPRHRGAGLRRLDRRAAAAPAIGLVRRQCRMADLRRHRAQPAARRRIPGQPRVCQGPRRHAAPRPDQRRRPHRPVRPRAHHAAPARRLAPRTRVDDPSPSCLRPARTRGLTSPDPVTVRLRPQRPPEPRPRAGNPDKPQDR